MPPRFDLNGSDPASEGMMAALLRPPVGRDADFNDWYDTEHAPARNELDGFLTARRWQIVPGWDGTSMIDDAKAKEENAHPLHYLATFDLDTLDVLDGDGYLGLRESASDREHEMVQSLTSSERRVYRAVDLPPCAHSTDLDICGPFLLAEWWEEDRETTRGMESWWSESRLRELMTETGTRRIRRFVRVDERFPGGFVALYDLESLAPFAHDAWKHRLAEGMSDSLQLFRLWRRFDPPTG